LEFKFNELIIPPNIKLSLHLKWRLNFILNSRVMDDPIRSIILPVLLLTVIVAIGVFYFKILDAFDDYTGDLRYSFSGLPDSQCPANHPRGARSPNTGGICTGYLAGTTSSNTETTNGSNSEFNYAPNGQWTNDITGSIENCTNGVLVAQVKVGSRYVYYPVCFPNGTTNVSSEFNNTNTSVIAYSQIGTAVTFYSGLDATGDVVGSLPQNNSNNGQYPNMRFKSIKVVMPAGSWTALNPVTGSGSGSRSVLALVLALALALALALDLDQG